MSDITPEVTEAVTDGFPDEMVRDVLERAGFKDSLPAEEVPDPEGTPAVPAEEEEGPLVETEGEVAPPEAPGGPLFPSEDEDAAAQVVTLPDGRQLPVALVQEWADKGLTPPAPTPTFPQPSPQPTAPALNLPVVTQEDLEMAGPAVQALLLIVNEQARQQKALQEQLAAQSQLVTQRQQRETAEIANSAASSFKTQFNLPDDLMEKVKNSVEVGDIESYLSRDPDPFKATEYALTRAYWNNPEARQYEFERQTSARAEAQTRKRKLAGVSGSGGSGPRGAPAVDENDPVAMKQAAVELVRQAMYGDGS